MKKRCKTEEKTLGNEREEVKLKKTEKMENR